MKTWADVQGLEPPSQTIDRDAGQGPPRCCNRRLIAADALVWFGEVAPARLAVVLARFPQLAKVPVPDLYLCDACRGTIRRERVLAEADEPNVKRVR